MRKFFKRHVILWALGVILITSAIAIPRVWHSKPIARWVIYSADSLNGPDQLVRVRANGSGADVLTDDFVSIGSPQWSPDGAWIAFWAAGESIEGRSYASDYYPTVYLMRPDGQEQRELAQFEDNRLVIQSLRWSADGEQVLFMVWTGSESIYYRVDRTGTDLQQWQIPEGNSMFDGQWVSVSDPTVTHADNGDYRTILGANFPGFEVPGTAWTYAVAPDNASPGLYRRALTPQGLVDWAKEPELVTETDAAVIEAIEAPDGSAVWFTTVREWDDIQQVPEVEGSDLYRYDLATDTVTHILGDDRALIRPSWSSDKNWLTLHVWLPVRSNLYLLDPTQADGVETLSDLPRLTPDTFHVRSLTWSPPVAQSFRWWIPLMAGIACLAWGVGLWTRALLRLRRAVGSLRLPVMQLVLADVSSTRSVSYA